MSLERSASLQEEENVSNEIKIKLAATQDVIKNKFSKAYANRIDGENNLNHVMQPLLMGSTNDATSLSNTKQSQPMTTKRKDADSKICKNNPDTSIPFIKNEKTIHISNDNPNELCDRLRMLLTLFTNDVKHAEEINSIINKLRELEILV